MNRAYFIPFILILSLICCAGCSTNKESLKNTPSDQRDPRGNNKKENRGRTITQSSSPDEGSHSPKFGIMDLVITFKTWPPDEEKAEPLLEKIKEAGFKVKNKFSDYRSWILGRDEEWKGGSIESFCSEIILDEDLSFLVESCEPDILIFPAR